MATKIEWTDEVWNPVVGCSKCSPGCKNCYAERMMYRQVCMGAARHEKDPDSDEGAWIAYSGVMDEDTHKWNGSVALRPEVLDKPLHWKKPRRIFVCSMGDLFHEAVPFEFVLKTRGISMVTPWHTYLILTKHIDRVLLFLEWWHEQWRKNPILWGKDALALEAVENMPANLEKANQYWLDNFDQSKRGKLDYPIPFPQPNIHLGVSVSTQAEADEKIPILLQIPAAVRFVSLEPLLGEIDFNNISLGDYYCPQCRNFYDTPKAFLSDCCGAGTLEVKNTQSEKCNECGEMVEADRITPQCPFCDNHGGGRYIQPDFVDCFSGDKEGAVLEKLNWVIIGCESINGRPGRFSTEDFIVGDKRSGVKISPENIWRKWAIDIVQQCKAAGVPPFVKQVPINGKVSKKMAEWPQELRVQEMPNAK